MSDAQQFNVKASTAEVTITDADGAEWTFELVPTGLGPIDLGVRVEQEAIEGPTTGQFRAFVSGPTHASVKVRGRLRSVSVPATHPAAAQLDSGQIV